MVRLRNLQSLRGERYFRWRGGDVSRIEGLTDGVLALAMTLLIVSLEVPKDFGTMVESFKQLPAFAVCFTLLVMLWRYHSIPPALRPREHVHHLAECCLAIPDPVLRLSTEVRLHDALRRLVLRRRRVC